MKNLAKFSLIMFVTFIINITSSSAQQPVFVDTTNTAPTNKCAYINKWETVAVDQDFKANSRSELIELAKTEVLKLALVNRKNTLNPIIYQALLWVAPEYVQIKLNDIYNNKIYIENARVNMGIINELIEALMCYLQPNTVVIYNPNFFKNDTEFGETIRAYTQSAYRTPEYTRNSLKSLSRMPVCNATGDPSSINYFDELLKCIDNSLGGRELYPKKAIVVQNYEIISKKDIANGVEVEIKIHIIIEDIETYSVVLDDFITGTGYGDDLNKAKNNAVENTINNNIAKLLRDEILTYFGWFQNGRKINLIVPTSVYGIFEIEQFKDSLNQNCLLVNGNEHTTPEGIRLEFFTNICSQSEIVTILKHILINDEKQSVVSDIITEGEYIKIVGKN